MKLSTGKLAAVAIVAFAAVVFYIHATGSIGGLDNRLADKTATQNPEAYAKAGEQLFGD